MNTIQSPAICGMTPKMRLPFGPGGNLTGLKGPDEVSTAVLFSTPPLYRRQIGAARVTPDSAGSTYLMSFPDCPQARSPSSSIKAAGWDDLIGCASLVRKPGRDWFFKSLNASRTATLFRLN
ncbi:MAG: hypothetical protein ACREDR_16830 [Blastocatellia bacterium]